MSWSVPEGEWQVPQGAATRPSPKSKVSGVSVPASGAKVTLDREAGERLYARLKWDHDRLRYAVMGVYNIGLAFMPSMWRSHRRWQRRHPGWTWFGRVFWLTMAAINFRNALIMPEDLRIHVRQSQEV